ncbi:hypothetical protein ACWIGI_37555 [Nocardia sp. NPDC055321]
MSVCLEAVGLALQVSGHEELGSLVQQASWLVRLAGIVAGLVDTLER